MTAPYSTRPLPPSFSPERSNSADSRELTSYTQVNVALQHDRFELQRDVLLWQRWIRYAAVVIAGVAAAILLGTSERAVAWVPLLLLAGVYFLFTAGMGLALRRAGRRPLATWVPWVVVVVDQAMIAASVYVSAPPAEYHRILILGFLVVQLTAFHFGQRLGSWAAALTLAGYVVLSRLVPPFVEGARPTLAVLAGNALTYAFVTGVLIATFGEFRERMNRLRVFVKRVELGDLMVRGYDEASDARPDDLTLLARSFNEMRERLMELIDTDPLTGLANRRSLETRLGREWRQARRRGSSVALLAIDIDRFKDVNDTHGHAVGDLALQELAEIMRRTARDTDVLGRLGGDEFLAVLPDAGWQGATTFAERLRRNVSEHLFGTSSQRLELTISIGVAIGLGTDPISIEELIEGADRALYKAKAEGRNRIAT